jgi:hypothetical protein
MRRHVLKTVVTDADLTAARRWNIASAVLMFGALPALLPMLALSLWLGLNAVGAVLTALCSMSAMLAAAVVCDNTGMRRLRYDRPSAIESQYGYRHAPSVDGDAR